MTSTPAPYRGISASPHIQVHVLQSFWDVGGGYPISGDATAVRQAAEAANDPATYPENLAGEGTA